MLPLWLPENLGEEFEAPFALLDSISRHRFDIQWHRHTGKWFSRHRGLTLADKLGASDEFTLGDVVGTHPTGPAGQRVRPLSGAPCLTQISLSDHQFSSFGPVLSPLLTNCCPTFWPSERRRFPPAWCASFVILPATNGNSMIVSKT